MSMIPIFPSLKPLILNRILNELDIPCDDENEIRELEKEHQLWLKGVSLMVVDFSPIGKTTPLNTDTDEEDANDDSEDTDSHDEDDEDDMDGIETTNPNDETDALDSTGGNETL